MGLRFSADVPVREMDARVSPRSRTVLAGSPRRSALQRLSKRSTRLSGRRSRRMVSNDEHGRSTLHRKAAVSRLRPDFPQHARGGHENCQGGHDVVWHGRLLLIEQKSHGDALSVADWIRLPRFGDAKTGGPTFARSRSRSGSGPCGHEIVKTANSAA